MGLNATGEIDVGTRYEIMGMVRFRERGKGLMGWLDGYVDEHERGMNVMQPCMAMHGHARMVYNGFGVVMDIR